MHVLPCVLRGRLQINSPDHNLPLDGHVPIVAPLGIGSTTIGTLFRNGCSEAGIDTGLAGYISLSVVPPKNALSNSLFYLPSDTQQPATHYPALFSRTFQTCCAFVPFSYYLLLIHRLASYCVSPSTHSNNYLSSLVASLPSILPALP